MVLLVSPNAKFILAELSFILIADPCLVNVPALPYVILGISCIE